MATAAVTDSSSSPTVFSSCLSLSRLLRGAGVGDPPARSSARHRRCAGRASAPLSLVSCFLPLSSSPCVFPPVLLSAPSVPSSRTQAPQQTHTPRDDTEQGEEDRRERRRSERARDRGHAWSSAAAQRQRSNPRSPEKGRSRGAAAGAPASAPAAGTRSCRPAAAPATPQWQPRSWRGSQCSSARVPRVARADKETSRELEAVQRHTHTHTQAHQRAKERLPAPAKEE